MSIITRKKIELSNLVEKSLVGLSPIQTIMKISEKRNIIEMGLNPKDIISFGGGWCNHYAPEALRKIYLDIISNKEDFHKTGRYSSIIGNYKCREQLVNLERSLYNVKDLRPENILIGHSSTHIFHEILRALCNPGDKISLLDPTYANYINAIKCALPGSEIKFIPALEIVNWTYLTNPENSLEKLKKHCENGSKLLVIPVPDNPTSQIHSSNFIKGCLEVLTDYNGFLILDYAYKTLFFNEMPNFFSWSVLDYPNLICINSNSKWLSSLGRRLGWIVADKKLISAVEKLNESVILSPDTLHSLTTAKFLENSINSGDLVHYVNKTRNLYRKTAEVLIENLDKNLGWKRLIPKGGLYTVCPTPNKKNPVDFVEEILKNTGVLLIPGTGFGPSMNNAIRLSYGPLCYDHQLIVEGIKRIRNYLD